MDALIRKKNGATKADVEGRVAAIADKMNAASSYTPVLNTEYASLDIEPAAPHDATPRRITSADFAPAKERTGVILDSSTHGRHEEPTGFDEHMKKVREQMRNKS